MAKISSLFSLVLMTVLTSAAAKSERLFSRRLAKKEGFELSQEEQMVDAFMTVLDHITRSSRDAQSFNGDLLLNMLKANRDVPFLSKLENRFQPVHDASKSTFHSLASIMNLWDAIAQESGIAIEDSKTIMTRHELFEGVSEKLDSGFDHKGQSAFGKRGHLKSNSQF